MKIPFSFVFFLVVSMFFPVQSLHFQGAFAESPQDEVLSWYFHGLTEESLNVFGNPSIQRGLVGDALSFDGKTDYLAIKNPENGTTPSVLTLSAWIKPDYAKSSSVLTVFHSKNSFELVIENYNSRHIAQFSIFDGNRWVSVRSDSEIPQEWTNIVATYEKNKLSLYINGNLDSEKLLYETIKYYAYGRPVEKVSESTEGPILLEDIFVGATKSRSGLTKFFSGQIDEVEFYLTPTMVVTGKPELKINNTYILNASECSSDNSIACNIQLAIRTEEENDNKVTVSFEKGTVSFNNAEYTIKEKKWRGTIPLKGGQTTLGGFATNSEGQEIYVILVGNFIENTLDGPVFRASGSIKTTGGLFGLAGKFDLKSVDPLYTEKPKPVEKKVSPPQILLLTRHFTSTFVGNYFRFDAKVYYDDKNPLEDFYQHGGEAEGATITAKLVSSSNSVLHTFEGNTDKNGHFAGEIVVPKYVQPGTYSFVVSAVKDGSVDTSELVTFISEEPRSKYSAEQNPNAPQISLTGSNPQIVTRGASYTELGATATDLEDGDLTASIVIDSSAVNTAVVGSYSVSYTVTDSGGDTSTATRTVNVTAGSSPVITLLGANPQTILKNSPYVELGATATDLEDGDLTASIVIDFAINTGVVGSYSASYTVTDSSGNTDTDSRIANVVAGSSPVITLLGASPQTIEVGSPYVELGATAADVEDGDITASIVINSSAVNTAVVGSYSVAYSVSDSSGNNDLKTRTVNIVAGMSPVITLNGTNPQTILKNSPYVELGATAADVEDGDITASIVIDSSAVNTGVVGSYSVSYTVTDSSDNTDVETRTVNVILGNAPVITLSGANPQTIEVDSSYVELGATAADVEDGDITASMIIDSGAVNTSILGTYYVTYDVTDSHSQTDHRVRTVNVVDTTIPVITLSGSNPQIVIKNYAYVEAGATCIDNYDASISGSIIISGSVNTSVIGSYTKTYTCTDNSSNTDVENRTVNVVTGNSPVITLTGANPQTIQYGSPYVELGATATDVEDGNLAASIIINSSAVNTSSVGTYSVTYTVTDISGNSDLKTRTVNVVAIPPGTPTGLSATAVSSSQINLSWTAPTSNGGAAITGYKIERESPVGGGWSTLVANTGSASTTYSNTGLLSNTQYNYRVSAINSVGSGSASSAANATTSSTVPGAPTGLSATAVSSSQINLSWTAPANNGGAAITGYQIERESPVGGGWSTLVADTGSTATTYQNTGLAANTQYNYRVSAINSVGSGSASSAANATTLVGAPTRLYFSNAATPPVNPSFDSWIETDSSARRQMLTAKSASEALALGTNHVWTAGNNQLDRQYISPPMNAGISFSSTTIKLQLACRESAINDNAHPRMSAKIVSQSGTTLRQTLLTIADYGTGSEYSSAASLRNVQFANGDALTGSYVTATGDRLVIEIGHADTSGISIQATCRYGAPSGTADHGENETDITSLVPWAEFSNTVTFQAGP